MRVRLLYTEGKGRFAECAWHKPDITDNEIEVKAVMTGVCRSDIDMMIGGFGPLPLEMQGHEGLGQVTKVGKNITNVKEGDFVATRGEPAYADYYNVRKFQYVQVPEASPKYILEPVACGLNCLVQPERLIDKQEGKRTLILGSGFLANVIYQVLVAAEIDDLTVVGKSNKNIWGDALKDEPDGEYDIIFDLSSRDDIFTKPILNENALIIFGSQKKITTDFGNLLWKACTMSFPSPRNPGFYECMGAACDGIQEGDLKVDSFWTRAYNRNTEWQDAFADGVDRPAGYNRGYIVWN